MKWKKILRKMFFYFKKNKKKHFVCTSLTWNGNERNPNPHPSSPSHNVDSLPASTQKHDWTRTVACPKGNMSSYQIVWPSHIVLACGAQWLDSALTQAGVEQQKNLWRGETHIQYHWHFSGWGAEGWGNSSTIIH